jgi:hypothetical protein
MKLIPFRFIGIALVSICAVTVQSCLTTTQPTGAVVMERSEQGRPSWVDNARAQEPLSERWFVYERRGLQRLELGIRQAQASALANHCKLIADRVRMDLSQLQSKVAGRTWTSDDVGFANLKSDSVAVVEDVIAKISKSDSCPELELKDVYWESVRKISSNGSETSFSVYVLLRLKPIAFDEVLAMTAESLKLSGQNELMPLAAETMQLMSTGSQQGSDE